MSCLINSFYRVIRRTLFVSVFFGLLFLAQGVTAADLSYSSTLPDSWALVEATEQNNWQSVTYGGGKFVAVSADGTNRVMHSTDGITWTSASAAEVNGWRSVTYGGGKFVAVSADGTNRVMHSTDGITWTSASAAESNNWSSVIYGNGQFVAVSEFGNTNRSMHSTDGITWTSEPGGERQWQSVTYGGGKFVAVSNNSLTERIMYTSYVSYIESATNNGSIDNTIPLNINISGDTFVDLGGGVLTTTGVSPQVTVGNVPAGLTPVMTLSNSDTIATLTFEGNATDHEVVDNISNLTFIFDDTAFVTGPASVITNSGDGGAYDSNAGIYFYNALPGLTYVGPVAYNISDFIFSRVALYVGGEEGSPESMMFNNDGTRLYVTGLSGDDINQYDLAVPYDISSAVFNSIALDISANETAPTSMFFNDDGSRLYILGFSGFDERINWYDLSVAYDVSTAVWNSVALAVAPQEGIPTSMVLSSDGTRLYVTGYGDLNISQYNLSVPYNLSTATFDNFLDISGQESSPQSLMISDDGTKIYLIGTSGDDINQYDLVTPYDLATATYGGVVLSVKTHELVPRSMMFNDNGTRLYVMGLTANNITEFSINYPEVSANDGFINNSNPIIIDITGDTFQDVDGDDILDVGTEVVIGNVPAGLTPVMTLSNGDTTVTLTFTGSAIDHENINDIFDLTFVFDDTAFVGNDASLLTNSGSGGAYSSGIGIDFVDDLTPPSTPVSAPDLQAGSDTGASDVDDTTSDNTPTLDVVCTEVGSTITLYSDNPTASTAIGTHTCTAVATESVTVSPAIGDGVHNMTYSETDIVGNESPESPSLAVTIDTSAPSAPVFTTITDDTGTSSTDKITSDQNLVFNGTAEANSTVEVFLDGVSIGTATTDGSGDWSFDHTGTTLASATYSVTTQATDTAGNTSAASAGVNVTVDTTVPQVPTVSVDTVGAFTVDGPQVSFTALDNVSVAYYEVEYNIDNGTTGVGALTTISPATSPVVLTLDPDETLHTITVRVYDTAGNVSESIVKFPPIVDITAPTPINNVAITDATITVTSPDGNDLENIVISGIAGATLGTCTGAGSDTVTPYASPVVCDITSVPVTGTLTVTAQDVGTSAEGQNMQSFIIETAPPTITITAPTKLDNATITDTTVTITDDTAINAADISISAVNTTGTFSVSMLACTQTTATQVDCTLQIDGNEGTGDLRITATDVAGNIQNTDEASYEIDLTPPSTPVSAPDLQPGSDTGASDTDDNTSDNTPTLDVVCTEVGSTITLYSDNPSASTSIGTHTCTAIVTESVTVSPAIADGVHNMTYTETDIAGNESLESPSLAVTVDTTVPSVPVINVMTDGVPVTGTADVGTVIVVTTPSGSTCTTVVGVGGTYSCILSPVPVHGEDVTVVSTDIAGNPSSKTEVAGINVPVLDFDGDGNPDLIEDAGFNSGDGNGDGILDSIQSFVSASPNPVTGAYTTLDVVGDCTFIFRNEFVDESALAVQDAIHSYPVGLADFTINCPDAGDSALVTLYYTQQYNTTDWGYTKYDSLGNVYAEITDLVTYGTATVGASTVTTVTFTVTDGDPQTDEDGIADGIINDPSGPSVIIAVTPPSSGGGGGISQYYKPTITSGNGASSISLSAPEGTTEVTDIEATSDRGTLEYSIQQGTDSDLFTINQTTGELIFKEAPDYESPKDSNKDNIYTITVRVDNTGYSGNLFDLQELSITVTSTDTVTEEQEINGEQEIVEEQTLTPEQEIKDAIKEAVPTAQCPFFTTYHRQGDKGDNVKKVEAFMKVQGYNIGEQDGLFDTTLHKAIIQYQNDNWEFILKPWGILRGSGTGFLYQSTRARMNVAAGCDVCVTLDNGQKVGCDKKTVTPISTTTSVTQPKSFLERVSGRILLQVQGLGEAWYVDPLSHKRFYLKDGQRAYQALRTFGLGITNEDLQGILVGIDEKTIIKDSDNDGLDDELEEALGTDPHNKDSDGDGYEDAVEVESGYSPLISGTDKMSFDDTLTSRLEGRILLQVQDHGEAWYIHNNKRYYLKDGNAAYQIMRSLSLGITDADLDRVVEGEM